MFSHFFQNFSFASKSEKLNRQILMESFPSSSLSHSLSPFSPPTSVNLALSLSLSHSHKYSLSHESIMAQVYFSLSLSSWVQVLHRRRRQRRCRWQRRRRRQQQWRRRRWQQPLEFESTAPNQSWSPLKGFGSSSRLLLPLHFKLDCCCFSSPAAAAGVSLSSFQSYHLRLIWPFHCHFVKNYTT